ncbi:MAG: manganese efflux pump [Firmicutes bacterium]|nr:manganese efflux pump [Bacillota bacterium]
MNLSTLLLVAIALGTDALSVAIGIGISGIRRRDIALLSGVISFFHVLMPLIGLFLGSVLGVMIGQYAALIGAGGLVLIGLQMVWHHLPEQAPTVVSWQEWRERSGRVAVTATRCYAPTLGGMVVLAGSVSLDALSVGFSLGTIRVNLPFAVMTMGVVAGLMTVVGLVFGRRLGGWLGEKAGVVGGAILVLIGVRMLLL